MPLEFYLGAVAAAILLVLLASLFRRRMVRGGVGRTRSETEQLVQQLSRIADALERFVAHFDASSPRAEPPLVSPQKALEKTPAVDSTDRQDHPSKPTEPHITLSMFGR